MKEKNLYNSLKTILTDCFVFRVENSVNPGFPDVFIIKDSNVILIENKIIDKWDSVLPFRPSQPPFINKYCKNGGIIFILFYSKKEKQYGIINAKELSLKDYFTNLLKFKKVIEIKKIQQIIFP